MEKERKLRCDCGGIFSPREAQLGHIITQAMVCEKCGYVTLTKEQAVKYSKLKEMHEIVDSKRKIIRIGNSLGLTLPEKLKKIGIKAGGEVKIEATGERSFSIEIL
jgi:DNA-directed RNA polymerase subunit M/transcription elongation factor TFIIS